jgi:hypothetical protein
VALGVVHGGGNDDTSSGSRGVERVCDLSSSSSSFVLFLFFVVSLPSDRRWPDMRLLLLLLFSMPFSSTFYLFRGQPHVRQLLVIHRYESICKRHKDCHFFLQRQGHIRKRLLERQPQSLQALPGRVCAELVFDRRRRGLVDSVITVVGGAGVAAAAGSGISCRALRVVLFSTSGLGLPWRQELGEKVHAGRTRSSGSRGSNARS